MGNTFLGSPVNRRSSSSSTRFRTGTVGGGVSGGLGGALGNGGDGAGVPKTSNSSMCNRRASPGRSRVTKRPVAPHEALRWVSHEQTN